MAKLQNKTILITGASRGVGRELAIRFARDGANIVIIAKTAEPDPRLPGTIHTVAEEVKAAGGKVLPIQADLRDENLIHDAIKQTVNTFGGIDILVNNASALYILPTLETPMKRFDLMFGVNVRATFATSQACIPFLQKAQNPHILNIAPPLNMKAKWFKDSLAYSMSKYGMSMCTLGLSAEFAKDGIAVNSLWPKYLVATVAVQAKLPPQAYQAALDASIVADAAYEVITADSRKVTGNFFLDEEVLKNAGMKDLKKYIRNPDVPPFIDFYID